MKITGIYKELVKRNIKGEKVIALFISLLFLLFYVGFQSTSIYGGDAGDLVTAAYVRGVAHPPGYPLYTFLSWIVTKIPLFTIAWRVGFMSSIPASLSIGILYLVLVKITKRRFIAVITACLMGFSYLFWLYATVAEVFALQVFFVLVLLYLSLLFHDKPTKNGLFKLIFIFGLSLTHHHTILFLLPGYLLLIIPDVKKIHWDWKLWFVSIESFLLGLTPYLYVIWAAWGNPVVNWEDPKTFSGFFRLISRAIYGTFRSGGFNTLSSFDHYFQLQQAMQTILIDFTKLGVVLIIIGCIFQFKRDRRVFFALLTFFLFSGPLFIFYASFPIVLNFYLGVTERFLLVPYIFLFIWMSLGISYVSTKIDNWLTHLTQKKVQAAQYIFLLLPIVMFFVTYFKIVPLRNDRTAEHLAEDILATVPDNSFVFLSDDTSLFNTQYIYFTRGGTKAWRGIKLFQFGTIGYDFYKKMLIQQYTDIDFSAWEKPEDLFKKIIPANYARFPIYSNVNFPVGGDYLWIQQGLLKKLVLTKDFADKTPEYYSQQNKELFASYHKPMDGALRVYTHVMLADVARVYSIALMNAGDLEMLFKNYPASETYYTEAFALQPEVLEVGLRLAAAYIYEKKCTEAESLGLNLNTIYYNDAHTIKLLQLVYKECFHDDAKAATYEELYKKMNEKAKTPLTDFER